ncbi:MAG: DUF4838 domain-containing protein [Thermoguttaceae bacterium]|nr:DUF4838 domain-containing protein [Thermoguttaceae bacterium]
MIPRVLLTVVATLSAAVAFSGEIKFEESGTPVRAIVLPESPTSVQQTAASDLQTYLERISTVRVPIVSEGEFSGEGGLVIGPGVLSQKLLGEFDESAIKPDGIVLKTVGSNLVLTGAPERGPIYAVQEFLESLGVRWWTSTSETVPSEPNLSLREYDVDYAPELIYRESFYKDAFTDPFAVRLRCNGGSAHISPERGGKIDIIFGCHSAFSLIPPKDYFKEHPDWFAFIDGNRRVGAPFCWGMEDQLGPGQAYGRGTQLCYSNDEMIAEMIENSKKVLREFPGATFIDMSQNDCEGYCQCEKCAAIDEEEGSHSGSLLRAVNKIAEALEEEFPNVYVETLAYRYTRKPPKITKPRRNVVVRLCSIECSFGEPLSAEINSSFREDLLGWSAICDKLFVWDYATDFGYYVLPFPNYRVIAPNIKFYAEHNVLGILEQGDYHSPTGDFIELRAWLVAKLLWNPNADVEALFEEFVSNYYAPELVPVYREYFDLLSDAVERDNFNLTIYLMTTRDWLDVETLTKCSALLNRASEIAARLAKENPERYPDLVERVEKSRLPLDAVWAQEYRRAQVETRLRGLEFLGPKDPVQAAKDFLQKLDDYGFVKRRESEPDPMYPNFRKETLEEYVGWRTPFARKPEVCEGAPDSAWLDLQEIDFVRKESGDDFAESESASNGWEVKIPKGERGEWTVPEQIESLSPAEEKDRIYPSCRTGEGASFKLGVGESEISLDETGGAELEAGTLRAGATIWIEAVDGDVFVDRLAIVRSQL